MLTDAFLTGRFGRWCSPAGRIRRSRPPTPKETSPRSSPAWCGAERVSVDSHFFDDLGADSLVMAQFCARVRKRPDLPSVSMKDIYQHPTISRLATALAPAATAEPRRRAAWPRCWPVSWGSSRCPVDSHFFDDLGADSLVMAQFCARVRKRPDLPSVSMKDIYQHPTITAPGGRAGTARHPRSRPRSRPKPTPVEVAAPVGTLRIRACADALQLVIFLGLFLPRRDCDRRRDSGGSPRVRA